MPCIAASRGLADKLPRASPIQDKLCQSRCGCQTVPGRTEHMSTASCIRTQMKLRPSLSGMPAFSSMRVTCREGLANTSCVPRAVFSLIQSCTRPGLSASCSEASHMQGDQRSALHLHSAHQPGPRAAPGHVQPGSETRVHDMTALLQAGLAQAQDAMQCTSMGSWEASH